jgi:predicted nucleic acid-binding protein
VEILNNGDVMCHPFIIGELACGNLKNRTGIISLLEALPMVFLVSHEEVLAFIETRNVMGKGLGYVDIHLLAATLLTGAFLWTLDKKLEKAAEELNCRHGQKTI